MQYIIPLNQYVYDWNERRVACKSKRAILSRSTTFLPSHFSTCGYFAVGPGPHASHHEREQHTILENSSMCVRCRQQATLRANVNAVEVIQEHHVSDRFQRLRYVPQSDLLDSTVYIQPQTRCAHKNIRALNARTNELTQDTDRIHELLDNSHQGLGGGNIPCGRRLRAALPVDASFACGAEQREYQKRDGASFDKPYVAHPALQVKRSR